MADAIRYRTMTTEELRETFLIDNLFRPGEIGLTYVDLDRTVIGSAVPNSKPLYLPTEDALKASFFTERRELGVLNIGGAGSVTANGVPFELKKLDALYVGRGNEEIVFSSLDPAHPAEFYLLSYPAHATHPTQLIRSAEQAKVTFGAAETANLREITKFIHLEGTRSCQLVMGLTARTWKCLEHDASAYAHEMIGSLSLFRHCSRPTSGSPDGSCQTDAQHRNR
jgi:4-deoxy-L-threo-5-hexosulose-uronate ketol-isomerase